MASVEVGKLTAHEKEELVVVYSALLLSDAGLPVEAGKIEALAKASGNKVNAAYATLFVKGLKGKKIDTLLAAGCSGGGAAGGAEGGKKEAAKEAPKDAKKEAPAKKETKKEEPKAEDDDMGGGLGLFDDF
mmetsp:Transcript_65186/g.75792  ORF Transcript_65186/g.75792 Transcript_65186/m.75792 type:complete len:131 (-) Transcript_65186:177-569(-)|eukprot:CAMPEP_0176466270 /NCGR_PEP_ID=MMETSP0127-20121128/37795_1 /TAXON_ID=938130 /ORGANISM="Platyophrya macrostoma, Strain WH" /LENGTH=130 /DNA_ID=CAMNT_0017859411 /DNA_START=50 /DNA_END=442 /DNA_ORIENTATION=+